MNIIKCYVPTNDLSNDEKDWFYERLQSNVEMCTGVGLVILIGNLNVKVGIDNNEYECHETI